MATIKNYENNKFSITVDGHATEAIYNNGWDGGSEIWVRCSCGWNGITIDRESFNLYLENSYPKYKKFYEKYGKEIFESCSGHIYAGANSRSLALSQLIDHTHVKLEDELDNCQKFYSDSLKNFENNHSPENATNLKNSIDSLVTINYLIKETKNSNVPKLPQAPANAVEEWNELLHS